MEVGLFRKVLDFEVNLMYNIVSVNVIITRGSGFFLFGVNPSG